MSELRLNQVVTPSTPASAKVSVFLDSVDDRIKAIHASGMVEALSPQVCRNLLVNGAFRYTQRQVPGTLTTYSNLTGRVYGADRFGMTNENASIQFQRIDASGAPETNLGARYYGKFKKISNAGKIAVSQVMPSDDTCQVRGGYVRLSAKLRYTVAASMTVRVGLLQLTNAGTVDTIPATFLSAFNGTGTDPTWGTNLALITPTLVSGGTLVGSAMTCVLTNTWARYSATFNVPANVKNLIAVIWANAQLVINDELNIAEIGLYEGQEEREWNPRLGVDDFDICQAYYCKTFGVDVAPAQAAGVTTGCLRCILGKAGATALAAQFQWQFPMRMRITPATVTTYSPASANATVRQISGTAGDLTATATANSTDRSVDITATGIATGAVGDQCGVHVTADAEL